MGILFAIANSTDINFGFAIYFNRLRLNLSHAHFVHRSNIACALRKVEKSTVSGASLLHHDALTG